MLWFHFETTSLGGFGGNAGTVDFGGKPPRHAVVTEAFGQRPPLFKDLDCARYSTLAEQHSGFAKDSGVTFTLRGGIHDDQSVR
jgi:hypothetical protein